jgi:hypothetical protein
MFIEIAGIKLSYNSLEDLKPAATAKLAEVEGKIKKLAVDHKILKKQRRALKQLLEGKKAKEKVPSV